jgi:hypothetical protein
VRYELREPGTCSLDGVVLLQLKHDSEGVQDMEPGGVYHAFEATASQPHA